MAAGEASDTEREQLLCADERGRFTPRGDVGKGKEPRSEAADGKPAHSDEGIAGEEGAVALVEKVKVAWDVACGCDATESAV